VSGDARTAVLAVTLVAGGWTASGSAAAVGSEPAPLSPGEHRLAVSGGEVAYHVHGHGPVLVAHPGGPGAEWRYLRMPLVEESFTVVYLEPIGTGGSSRLPRPSDYRMERYVSDLEALQAHLGVERICLLGHSHGGFVAQSYALAHPEHLAALVLYDTSPTTGEEWQADVEANLEWFAREPWFADAKAALAEETSATTDEAMTAVFAREEPLYFADWTHRHAEFERTLGAMRFSVAPTKASDPSASAQAGVAPPFDVRARLGSISTPTLVVVGRKDFVCSVKMAKVLAAGIPGARLVVLERSGHMGHVEEPEAFARALAGLVGERPR
jgi:proline iminopeptidase